MDKMQLNVKEVSQEEFDAFLTLFRRDFVPRSVKPTDDNHFVVCQFGEGKDRFNVCYDRLARSVQATADDALMDKIKSCLYIAKSASLQEAAPVKPDAPALAPEPVKPAEKPKKIRRLKKALAAETPAPAPVPEKGVTETQYKDGYSLTKYELSRLEQGIEVLKACEGVAEIVREESNQGTPQHFLKFVITGRSRQKAIVQYAINRKVVQIQGKPSELTDLVQNALSETAGEKEIIRARADYNKTRASKKEKEEKTAAPVPSAIQKSLTKMLPNGVRYLSKQSQTYLYYTLTDLNSNLSDYGGILATAYKGLENLIATLQQSENIKVKMIGQAYEKMDGKYSLKAAYRRKIRSIVFNEVMSALYTEYFEKRHYYTHSDNFSDEARVLNDKSAAKAEFDRLIKVIEYNCTKLSEIGFRIEGGILP